MMKLVCEISQSLADALAARSATNGDSISHIVMSALADALGVDHATLFQVSTSTALVQGVYQEVVTVGDLKQHGDFGLGTFVDLDGEMMAVDGRFFQIPGTGPTREAADSDAVPFAVVTTFHPDQETCLKAVTSFDDLTCQLDLLRGSNNLFYAVRLDGRFAVVHTRAVCKVDPGVGLADAAHGQSEFDFTDVDGTIVGFWTPAYAKTLNIAGWHLHFLTAARDGGGHLLQIQAHELRVQVQHLDDFRMAIPETADFLKADLTGDPSQALDEAERQSYGGRTSG
jgi:acetolactate decarboxylase